MTDMTTFLLTMGVGFLVGIVVTVVLYAIACGTDPLDAALFGESRCNHQCDQGRNCTCEDDWK